MKIIISPAKKMKTDTDTLPYGGFPVFLKKTDRLLSKLREFSFGELQALFGANESITRENLERFATMDLREARTPAILSYVGIQYQYMAPQVFTDTQWVYICDHLRIISGFYGLLRPDDRVMPYRLEMQAPLPVDGKKDLYAYWGGDIYRELIREDGQILNLASKEYSRCVESCLTPEISMTTCVFGELQKGKVKVKGTYAKMARGEMVRWLSLNRIERVEEARDFRELGYRYAPELSGEREYVFLQERERQAQDIWEK